MIRFISNEFKNSDSFIHVFQCDSDSELANATSQIMLNRGYKLIEGTIMSGVYEKGNRTMRILFGAFSKYFKINVSVLGTKVNVASGSSGFSGGVIGIGQVRKEIAEIADVLQGLQ